MSFFPPTIRTGPLRPPSVGQAEKYNPAAMLRLEIDALFIANVADLRGLIEEINNDTLSLSFRILERMVTEVLPVKKDLPTLEKVHTDVRRFYEDLFRVTISNKLERPPHPHPGDIVNNFFTVPFSDRRIPVPVLRQWIKAMVAFHRRFPRPANSYDRFPLMTEHFLLGTHPSLGDYLQTITWNLEGFERLFGEKAGLFFNREVKSAARLRDGEETALPFYLVLEKGYFEYEKGLQLAIFGEENATGFEQKPFAKIGFNFGPNQTLRIVALQGPSPRQSPESRQIAQLSQVLEGSRLTDMLLASAILMARNAGCPRVEGIRDSAQKAREDAITYQGGKKGLYDLAFKGFGFTPPSSDSDYWSLPLETEEMFRGRYFTLLGQQGEKRRNSVTAFWKILGTALQNRRVVEVHHRKLI